MMCGIGPQSSLRDSRPFGVKPSVETLGYSRLSLRDSKAAVFPCRQNAPGVQQYDLWVMTSIGRERAGVRVSAPQNLKLFLHESLAPRNGFVKIQDDPRDIRPCGQFGGVDLPRHRREADFRERLGGLYIPAVFGEVFGEQRACGGQLVIAR